jgi:hypothetical protein
MGVGGMAIPVHCTRRRTQSPLISIFQEKFWSDEPFRLVPGRLILVQGPGSALSGQLAKKEIPRFWQRGILTQTNKHKNYLVQFYGGY